MSMLPQVLIEGVFTGMIIALVASGVSIIWGVMEIVNFAQGEFLMIGMLLAYFFSRVSGLDPLFCIPICIVFMYFFGVMVYKVLIRKVLGGPMLSQLLLTSSLSLVLINLSLVAFGGSYKTIPHLLFTGTIKIGGLTIAMTKLVPFFIGIITSYALYYILNKTKMGQAIKATALNKTAAALVGINPEKAYANCFGLATAAAGIAGLALSYYFYVYPSVGQVFINFGFVACCLGGMGSVPGAVLGGLVMGLVDSTIGTYFNVAFKYVAVFGIYLFVVTKKPKGFFGW